MSLDKYVRSINKEKCEDCKFNNKQLKPRPIIIIPPPDTPKIMLISRDPTVDFIPIYEYSKRYSSDEMRRMLFSAAIPHNLIVQITKFCRREKEGLKESMKNLFKIFEVAYWTHLHKCPTDKENKFTTACANKWLRKEINEAKEEGIQTMVCLGKDVERWASKNIFTENIKIINLPHPSRRNPIWYTRDNNKKMEIKKSIKRLIELC